MMVPEDGITKYYSDRTQGPACALAAAAGLQYRQHSVKMPDGTRGQTSDNQINTLATVEEYLHQHKITVPWSVRNGYIDADPEALTAFNKDVLTDPNHCAAMRAALRIGIQWDTQVTAAYNPADAPYLVTQTYNSAVSVGYSRCGSAAWQQLATLVLEASYEATLLVGILNNCFRIRRQRPLRPVVLTKVGAGAFQNDATWVQAALRFASAAVTEFRFPVPCVLVHYGSTDEAYTELLDELNGR